MDRTIGIAAFVSVVLAAILWVSPAVLRADIFDGDAAHHVFWLYKYADPALFPGDITVDYLRTSAPLGYRALYAVIAPVADVLLATEVLSGVLFLVAGWLAWKLGTALDGPDRSLRGLFAVATLIGMVAFSTGTDLMPAMAFQRTFALPLTLLCLWALISHRYVWVGFSWVGAALFYPVLLPVLGLGAGFVFLRDMIIERRMPSQWIVNAVLAAAALALAIFGIPKVEWLGPAIHYAEASTMPEFGANGRLRLHVDGIIGDYLRFHMMGLGYSLQFVVILIALTGAAWVLGKRRLIPPAAWIFVGVGLTLWVVMRLFPEKLMFGLYLPNRHTRWSIAAFAIVACAAGGYALFDIAVKGARERWSYALALATPILTIAVLLPHTLGLFRQPVDEDLENTYAFIQQLPKQTLVAAHPDLASYVPLRARHSVLASTETSMPWYRGYYAKVKPRVEASLRAAYATSMNELDADLAPYGVDVFITGPAVWQSTGYLDPYNSMVQQLIERGKREGFALQHPPEDRILFRSGDYTVIRLNHAITAR